MTAAWLGPLPDPHENCGQQWECWECGATICPRCEHSPGEFTLCAACFDFKGRTI